MTKLYEIAHARSGDKFNTSLITIFPYKHEDMKILRKSLTTQKVKNYLGKICKGKVNRIETKFGLQFTFESALDGGVVGGLRRDKHGKSLSGYILQIKI